MPSENVPPESWRSKLIGFFQSIKQKLFSILKLGTPKSVQPVVDVDQKLVENLAKHRWPGFAQLKYVGAFLSHKERWLIRGAIALILISAGFIGWRWYSGSIVEQPTSGGEYIEGVVGTPQYINPWLASNNDIDASVASLIFSGLFKKDSQGKATLDLAESYKISDDGKIYDIKLRSGLTWHDGEPLTAQDVVFTINGFKDPELASPLFNSFRDVEVDAIDDNNLQFTISSPDSEFLSRLTAGILPSHLWGEIPASNIALAEYNLDPIGSGPWKFEKLTKDKSGNLIDYRLIYWDKYYGTKPYLKTITFKFYPSINEAVDALANKRIDGLSFVPPLSFDQVNKNKNLNYYNIILPQYSALFFNSKDNKIFQDKLIRLALGYAVDRDSMIRDILFDRAELINSPVASSVPGYDSQIVAPKLDLNKSKELLTKAGWTWDDTQKGWFQKKEQLKISLTTVDQPEQEAVAEKIKNNWEALGIPTDIVNVSSTDVQRAVLQPRDYQVLLYGEVVPTAQDLYYFWHSGQINHPGLNLAMYSNGKVDGLLDELRTATKDEEIAERVKKLQDLIATDYPAIFLYRPFYFYAVDKKIKGINFSSLRSTIDRFNNLSDWYINSQKRLP